MAMLPRSAAAAAALGGILRRSRLLLLPAAAHRSHAFLSSSSAATSSPTRIIQHCSSVPVLTPWRRQIYIQSRAYVPGGKKAEKFLLSDQGDEHSSYWARLSLLEKFAKLFLAASFAVFCKSAYDWYYYADRKSKALEEQVAALELERRLRLLTANKLYEEDSD